jgi:ABC-type amino acid transport system permease subunit
LSMLLELFGVHGRLNAEVSQGVYYSLTLSTLAIVAGTLLGVLAGTVIRSVERNGHHRLAYVMKLGLYLAMSIPVYLALYWLFLIPAVTLPPLWIAILVLSLNLAAFVGKIVCDGYKELPGELIEAARLSGFSRLKTLLKFEMPLVRHNIQSAILVEWTTTIKLTSLVGVIGIADIMETARREVLRSFDPKIYFFIPLVYAVPVVVILLMADHVGAHVSRATPRDPFKGAAE